MNKIRIGLWGFGHTGHVVAEEFLKDEVIELKWIVKKTKNSKKTNIKYLAEHIPPIYGVQDVNENFFEDNNVDIIVDFSNSTGYKDYQPAIEQGIRIISAVSAYDKNAIQALKKYSEKTAVLYSPNITLGVNFLMVASLVFQKIAPHADIEIIEEHFREKKEISGTALKIAKVLGLHAENQINSIRVGGIVGKHEVIFGLKNQTVRIIHESINKAAFGQGAIFASKWLIKKSTGFYSMEEIITDLIRQNLPTYQ